MALRSRGRRAAVPTEELARLYFEEGLSLRAVAQRVELADESVRERLLAAGYDLRPHARSGISTEELARLYFDQAMPLVAVAQKTGLHPSTVHERLVSAGYVLRPRGNPRH